MKNTSIRGGLLSAFLVVILGIVAPFAYAQQIDWTGDWDATWKHRGARVSLVQDGDQVTGGYKLYGGTIQGTIIGRELRGVWKEGGRQGTFVAVMSTDTRTFTARFGTGEWMTGIRVLADNQFLGEQLDRSIPAQSVYHFLSIMNAVGPGRMELQSEASLFIDFAEQENVGVSKLEYTQTLFSVLNGLTFPVWTSLNRPAGSEISVTLGQAGTDVAFVLRMVKKEGQWLLAPPPMHELKATAHALSKARPQVHGPRAGLQSPRDTMRTLVHSFSEAGDSMEQAMSTLNMSGLSALAKEYEGPKLARYVNRSLQRIGPLTWQEISDDPARTSPYLHFEHPFGRIEIGPVITEDGVVWQFTPETLETIRAVYAALDNFPPSQVLYLKPSQESLYFKARDFVSHINRGLVEKVGPMEVWQWLGLLAALVMALALGRVLNMLFQALVLRHFSQASGQRFFTRWLFLWSFRFFAIGLALRVADRVLGFPDLVQVVLVAVSWTCAILSSMMLVLLGVGMVVGHLKATNAIHSSHITPLSFVAGIIRVAVVVFAMLMLADVLQVPYQSVLAGLGLGGLAVALAAQSTLQNFISGITLYFDKPIAVGDYCQFGDKSGTVEFIGMRSTRIRTQAHTLLTIPNSEFSNMQIENYAKRDRMFLITTLNLRYETSPEQLRHLLSELRALLLAHPKVANDSVTVRFEGFGAHSLDIAIAAYVLSNDYSDFVEIREDIYLNIMQVIEALGTKLAVPAVVNYNSKDSWPEACAT